MTALSPPAGYPFPVPTDDVLIGFPDPSFVQVRAMRRDSIVALLPYDVQLWQTPTEGEPPVLVNLYGVVAAGVSLNGIVVAAFDDEAERRAWLIANAPAWLGTAPTA